MSSAKSVDALVRSRVPYAEEYYDRLQYEIDPLGGFRLAPNQKLPHVSINSRGYRGAEWTGREEVLLLGDSVTFGVGAASDAMCLARFLEARSGLPVADASVRAYRAFQHYAQLPHLMETLPQLRKMLLWLGFVDLLYWSTSGGCLDGAFQFERKYAPDRRAFADRSFPINLVGATAAAFVSRLSRGNEDRACRKGSVEEMARYVAVFVEAMRDLGRARGVEMRVLVQPFIRRTPKDPECKIIADHYNDRTAAKCRVQWYDVADSYVAALMDHLQRKDIPVLDLQHSVGEAGFIDQVHLREEAMRSLVSPIGAFAFE